MRLWSIVFSNGYYLTEGSRNNTTRLFTFRSTYHCMRFAAACLTICEYGSIVSIEYILDKRKGALLINVALWRFSWEDAVEWEAFRLFFCIFFYQIDLVILWIHLHNANTGCVNAIVPLSRYLEFIGRHLTMTFTASAISLLVKNIILFIYCLKSIYYTQ
jgi:hypothetical protein